MLPQVVDCQNTHSHCTCMQGEEETSVLRPHTHTTHHTHLTMMYYFNCVNSNITLRPSTHLHLAFVRCYDVNTLALN